MQKTAHDKKLIQLHKELKQISVAKANLGYVPLEPPIQKGWKRYFVLRDDVQRSRQADFFQILLDKINTVQYSSFKAFKVRRRRFGKKSYEPRPQNLQEFHEYAFQKLQLTDSEKLYFREELRFGHTQKDMHKMYVFTEPWRFVLVIRPNMITLAKVIDPVLEQQQKEICLYMENRHLWPKTRRLLDGAANYRDKTWDPYDKAKYDYISKENLEIKQSRFIIEH